MLSVSSVIQGSLLGRLSFFFGHSFYSLLNEKIMHNGDKIRVALDQKNHNIFIKRVKNVRLADVVGIKMELKITVM